MFGSDIIDTGIGLFLTYFLFSALCSAINEWIVGHIFKWRAEILERSLGRLLGGEQTAKEFFDQPLIQSLANDGKARPAYLSASMFIDGLIALVKDKATTAQPPVDAATLSEVARDPQKLLAALEKINNPNLQSILQSLLDGAKDIETARKKLEGWFNEGMDRATGWYKRHVRVCMIGIAVAVAVIFNVDTFTLARAMMSDPKLRAALLAAAQETVKQPANNSTNALPSLETIQKQIKDLELPIGWPSGDTVSQENPDWVLSNVMPLRAGETWGMKLLSLLLTAAALSLGAPFWFDLLNKVVNLRATGMKPAPEKGKKEP